MSLSQFLMMGGGQNINLWVSGCPHCPADTAQGRSSLTLPLSQIDAGAFTPDFGLILGDFDSNQDPPDLGDTTEGEDIAAQLNSGTILTREKIETMAGNHDGGNANMDFYLRYVDPLGDNTAYSGHTVSNDPYPRTLKEVDSWDAYYRTFGNVRVFMLSDRNDLPYPYGRGGTAISGGHPSGTITKDTWEWVKSTMEAGTNYNYIICSHANPRYTTIATPDGDEACGNHQDEPDINGGGSLHNIYDEDVPGNSDNGTTQFLDYFADNPNHNCVMWVGSHTHNVINSTCGTGSRSIKWTENGVQFLNIANLTYYHGRSAGLKIDPKSWLFNINNNRINCKMYVHQITETASIPVGFYAPQEFNVDLKV